jgi:lysophospholipase L1-like esterase
MVSRSIFLLLVALAISPAINAQATNQNLYDTLPTMPDHYKKRLAEFRNDPVVTDKIIFLGNSITEGGQWQELTGDRSVVNRGIGGDVTFGILNRLDDIIVRRPAKLFILIGINDISKDFPANVIVENYRSIIQSLKAKSPKTKIYVQSLLPVNPRYPRFPQHYDKGDHVIVVNHQLQELAAAENVAFINLYPLFLDQQNFLNANYTYDGLHLNAEGYKVWAKFLKENSYL